MAALAQSSSCGCFFRAASSNKGKSLRTWLPTAKNTGTTQTCVTPWATNSSSACSRLGVMHSRKASLTGTALSACILFKIASNGKRHCGSREPCAKRSVLVVKAKILKKYLKSYAAAVSVWKCLTAYRTSPTKIIDALASCSVSIVSHKSAHWVGSASLNFVISIQKMVL